MFRRRILHTLGSTYVSILVLILRNPNLPSKNSNTGPTFRDVSHVGYEPANFMGMNEIHLYSPKGPRVRVPVETHLEKVGPVFEFFEGRCEFLMSQLTRIKIFFNIRDRDS